MILTTRKVLDEGTQWTRVEHRLKTWLYSVMHELVQAQVINSLVYKLLLVIEALQYLWYAIHPHFKFLWTVKVVDWLREFLRFLQFDGFLTNSDSNSQNIFIIILYIVFGIQVLMTVIIVCQIRFCSTKKQPSTVMAYSIKGLSGYIMLLNTVFTLPFYYIFMAAFICRSGDPIHGDLQCYKSTYFVHFVVALIGIILLIPISILTATLCIDLNPWSTTPFASPKSRLSLVKLISKIVIPIFFIIDYNGDAAEEFLIVYTVFWLLMLVLRYRQTPYYSKSLFNLTLTLEMFLFWTSLVGVLHAFIDNFPIDNIGFLFLWLGAPFIVFTYTVVVNKRRKIYRRLLIKNLKKDTEVEMYIISIIDLIEQRNNIRKRITLEGLLKSHMKTCGDKELGCVCHSLHNEYLKEQDAPEKIWYLWVKAMILEGIQRFPKSSRLRMLYAYIQREKLHNKFKALFEIMFAYNNKPTLEEEFSIYRYKNLIEEEMIESDMKIAENKGVNVNVIVGFENKFVDFQFAIGAAVELHLDFWRELQENNPEIQKLQSLGSMITKSVEEVTKHYQGLLTINPNHVKMLQTYGNFLRDIVNDEAEGQKILEKAEYNNRTAVANRQFLDNERLKYGDNSNTCIITVSGEVSTMGIVTNANNDITRILGFNKSELIGQNIYNIMPKFLTEIHDGFMHNYFESADAKVIAIERVVFPINKLGYSVPCTLMAKVLPNLDEGLKLVGFLKEIDKNLILKEQEAEAEEEEDHYVLYDVNTGIVHGITYGCKKEFGIPASLVQNPDVATDEFTIDQIFPEIVQINVEELKNSGGLITVIDTSSLEQDYILEKGEEGSGYGDGDEKERKFRKAKVKVSLFQDDEFGDISLRVLKFMEIKEDTDHASPKYPLDLKESDGFKNEGSLVKVRPGERDGQEELDGSRMDQNASELESNANNELNEEMRDLKEFKAMISEKTVPKSIRLLRNAVIVIYLLMLALICLGLGFYSNLVDEFNSGTSTVSEGYKRHDITAEVNYRLRKLQLLASGITATGSTTERDNLAALLRSQETALIDNLRTVTLQIGDDQDRLQGQGFAAIETDNVLVQSLLQNGVKVETRFFSDAMSQYTSHATSASNAALTSFTSTSVTDSTQASFYYVRRNGLGPLRAKSEYNAAQVTNFYTERTDSYDIKFRIIMIALIVLIGLSELILIPIIFSVHKTATKVLSLFGYIPLNEIVALSNKCEKYIQHYLENHRAQHEYGFENDEDNSDRPSKTSRMGDHTYVEVNQGQNDGQLSVQGVDQDINASYLVEMSLEDSTRKISGLKVPETMLMKQVTGSPGTLSPDNGKGLGASIGMDFSTKPLREDFNMTTSNQALVTKIPDARKPGQGKEDEKKVLVADEEDLDLANDRPTKLLNSKDNTKSKVIVQFCFIGLLFVTYFVVDYVVERESLQNIKNEFTHLQLLSQRMPNIRFLNAFTLEPIAERSFDQVFYYGKNYVDYRVDYHSRTLANSGNLKDSASTEFPSEFDSYLSTFTLYNDKDLCANYYYSDSTAHSKCLSVGGGLLTQGLTLSITRITQFSNDLINEYLKNDTVANQKVLINSDKLAQIEDLTDMIAPVIGASRDKFLSSFRDYLSYCWTVARIRFAVFVSLAILAFIVVWTPYLKSMKDKIFRTKGMLNMIPMELIAKNANLRSLFVNSGDILQAVK